MMARSIVAVLVLGCASAPETVPAPPPYDYGGLRRPASLPLATQDEPFVPPPAPPAPPDPPKPKVDPCVKKCDDFAEANSDCGSWTASCNRIGNPMSDVCREKAMACKAADEVAKKLGACRCE